MPIKVFASMDDKFFIEVTVSTAREAQEILDDSYRHDHKKEATNYFIFMDESIAQDVLSVFNNSGIEILNTNIEE